MRVYFYVIIVLLSLGSLVSLNSCNNDTKEKKAKLSQVEGDLFLGIDEGLEGVMSQIVKVYDSSFPKVQVELEYGYENDIMESLMQDKIKIAVITRDVKESEYAYAEQNRFVLKSLAVAKDAIAVIGHPNNEDSFLTVSQIKSILKNEFSREYNVIINSGKSAITRYLKEEVLDNGEFGENIYSQGTDEEIINYVNNNKNTIGFLSINLLYEEESKMHTPEFRKDINMIPIYNDSLDKFVLPYQAYLALDEYPFTRSIYFINRDNRQVPSTGFANFLASEPAQLLFKKAMFVPLRSQLIIRPVEIL